MQDNMVFQGGDIAPSPYPVPATSIARSGVALPYRPEAGRADRLSANIPGMVGAIGNIGDKLTGGMGGSNY